MRVSRIVFVALCLLPVTPRAVDAAACNGHGVPEALALVREQCCPARNHGAYVSCAAHALTELVQRDELQASCKHLIFRVGCAATTTTTAPPESTTTSTTHPGQRNTTTTVAETTTTTTAVSSTTSTTGAAPSTTSSTAPAVTTTSTSTPGASSTTTTTLGGEPGLHEICGNCIDDDHNGLTDFEDPACCAGLQSFAMTVRHGKLKPRGATTRLRLKTTLAERGLASVNPLEQDVFLQIRPIGGAEALCATIPHEKFMRMHGTFKFWDHKHLVASAKGIDDLTVKVRRDGSVRLGTVGRHVQFQTPQESTLQVTVGFYNRPAGDAANRCSTVTDAFRTGRSGQLLVP